MRRWAYIAAFGLMLSSLPLWAQRGGGGHAGSGGHSFGSVHSGSFGHQSGGAFASRGFGANGFSSHSNGIRLRIGTYPGRGGYGRSRYPYYPYYPYGYYPYLGYAWDADSYGDQSGDADAYADSNNAPPYADDSGLQRDMQSLNGKIDRLQADVEARNQPKQEQEPETALVFRDKHVEEVRNYAISGGALWVLNDQSAKKIPLTQIDVEATAKLNEEHGVDFKVPEPALQLMIVR